MKPITGNGGQAEAGGGHTNGTSIAIGTELRVFDDQMDSDGKRGAAPYVFQTSAGHPRTPKVFSTSGFQPRKCQVYPGTVMYVLSCQLIHYYSAQPSSTRFTFKLFYYRTVGRCSWQTRGSTRNAFFLSLFPDYFFLSWEKQ